jgi:hypothetical protein
MPFYPLPESEEKNFGFGICWPEYFLLVMKEPSGVIAKRCPVKQETNFYIKYVYTFFHF